MLKTYNILSNGEKTWSNVSNYCFLTCQIFCIIGIDIEIERFFSFARMFTNLKKYHL
jgi:hypothetical protein